MTHHLFDWAAVSLACVGVFYLFGLFDRAAEAIVTIIQNRRVRRMREQILNDLPHAERRHYQYSDEEIRQRLNAYVGKGW